MAYTEHNNALTRFWFKIVLWREKHIKERSFLILLALVVGILGGLAAQLLKFLIHLISHSLTGSVVVTTANWLE